MAPRRVPLLVASALALATAAGSACGPGALHATYRFDLARSAAGEVDVTLSLEGALPAKLALRGLLRDRLNGIVRPSVRCAERELPVREEAAASGDMRFTRWIVEPPAGARRVDVRYAVHPSTHLPPNGERELRGFGMVAGTGCALALAQAVLVPEFPLAEARVAEIALPPDWSLALPLPQRFPAPSPASWFAHALVAGAYDGERLVSPGVSLHVPRAADPPVVAAAERVLAQLARCLGPPRRDVRVALVAYDPERALTTELPGTVTSAVVEMRSVEPGALRRLVRQAAPLWLGRPVLELELDEGPDAWFPLGLVEELAHTLPEELGLVARDADANLENTWMREEPLRRLELAPAGSSPTAQLRRRMAARVLVHEIRRELAPFDLAAALRVYDGTGLPELADPAAAGAFAAVLRSRVEPSPRVLAFEPDWSLELAPRPTPAPPAGAAVRPVTFAFTSDTAGFLETCGCKLSQDGGVARRASVVAALRARDPGLVLLDLGNFAPLEQNRPDLDPLVESELDLYLATLETMGYDAAAVGPDELYCGAPRLREASTGPRPTLVGAALRVGAAAPYAPSTILERDGLRIGFLGYSELLEHGPLREAQERNMSGVRFPRAVAEVEPDLRALRERVDLLVVGGRMRPQSLRELCREDLGVDLVLVGGLAGYRALEGPPIGFLGHTAVALEQLTTYGISRVTAFVSPIGRVQSVDFAAITLDPEVPDDPFVAALLDEFHASLATRADLLTDVRTLFDWDDWQRDDYVGVAACAACHAAEHAQWSGTPHAQAMNTLVRARRDRHPKCVQCHVVGYGASTGYRPDAPDERLLGVQCEVCHGAGGAHARSPSTANIRRSPPARVCLECHDTEHSERFAERLSEALDAVRHR